MTFLENRDSVAGKKEDKLVCDALLDQDIFAGVGNIIKNEVLYRIRVHPASRVQDLPAEKLHELNILLYRLPGVVW